MTTQVISLNDVRSQRRLAAYQEKIGFVLESNRHAIGRLYQSGALFSRQGTRAGRDLLLAHQHLLKVVSLLEQLTDQGNVPAPRQPHEIDAVYKELDLLLERTGQLTAKTGTYLARLRSE